MRAINFRCNLDIWGRQNVIAWLHDFCVQWHIASMIEPPRSSASYAYLYALNAFALTNGAFFGTAGLLILPIETLRLWPNSQALSLGLLLAATGITQLFGPVVGYFSDRCTHRLGRRRPFLIVGAAVAIAGLLIEWYARERLLGLLYGLGTMMAVAGANAIYAAYNGLLPDLLPHEIMGKASGVMTVLNSAGAAIGFVVLGVLDVSISYAYPLYALMTVATVGIVCAVAKETPLEVAAPWSCAELFDSFRITPASHGNFFWVFVIRTLYYTALSVFSFIVLYLRDVTFLEQPLLSADEEALQRTTGIAALLSLASSGLVAVPMGVYSDSHGRKPALIASALIMSGVYLGLGLAPPLYTALTLAFIFGAGNGVFLAVDYALAVDTLPTKETAAKDLGLWGIAAFIGSAVGPMLHGPLLHAVGSLHATRAQSGEVVHYGREGYLAILSSGSALVLSTIFLLPKVVGVR